eukprot:TRINITY_DN12050_c0_g1_i1.p1 TRINITY_DN12050_c0_g1~~TRINITY_DN12050_c0_g1_i1.p1  ORF type:complete len:581 (+),score=112.87 TRINITY_DN12050_c0_g1_i1:212-1744(+)
MLSQLAPPTPSQAPPALQEIREISEFPNEGIEPEPEPELPPELELLVEDEPKPEPEPEPELSSPPPAVEEEKGFTEFHRWVLADSLSQFNDKWNMRRAMEKWVAFTSARQRQREIFLAHFRGTSLITTVAVTRSMWRAYHKWRLWLGLRRRHPQAFGLIPRALIYDPAEPEVGDVETIKERITYHTGEIDELSNVVRRHSEIVELLRATLQKKLTAEMERLNKETLLIEKDQNRWSAEPVRSPPVLQQQPVPPKSLPPLPPPPPPPIVVPVLTQPPVPFSPPPGIQIANHAPLSPLAEPFTVPFQGYISSGGDLENSPRWMAIEEAREEATEDPRCMGFTYNLKHTTEDGKVLVYFKGKSDVHSHAAGWCSYTRPNTTSGSGNNMVDEVDDLAYSADEYAALSPRMLPPINPATRDPSIVLERLGLNPGVRRRLIDFYQFYNPSKLPSVLHTMHEFQGHEEALFQALSEQYGVEPPFVNHSLPEGWSLTESSKGDLFYRHVDGKKQWHLP